MALTRREFLALGAAMAMHQGLVTKTFAEPRDHAAATDSVHLPQDISNPKFEMPHRSAEFIPGIEKLLTEFYQPARYDLTKQVACLGAVRIYGQVLLLPLDADRRFYLTAYHTIKEYKPEACLSRCIFSLADILAYSTQLDLAFGWCQVPREAKRVAFSKEYNVGDEVHVVASSECRNSMAGKIVDCNPSYMLIKTSFNKGFSGSPVVTSKGVIGLATLQKDDAIVAVSSTHIEQIFRFYRDSFKK